MATVYHKGNIPVISETVLIFTDRDCLRPGFVITGNSPVMFFLPDRVGKDIENPARIKLL